MKKGFLEALDGKRITIIGHDGYDIDSVISSLLLSKLLTFLNIDNKVVILEKIKDYETFIKLQETFEINLFNYFDYTEDEDRNLFLVDHYETYHFGNVVGCIDHHPTSEKIRYKYYYFKKSCATAYIIYELMQEFGYQINAVEAKMIIMAMMSDTVSFRNSKTVKAEVEVAKSLASKYNIDFEALEKYCLCLTDISNLTIDEIIFNGIKTYDYRGNIVKASYLQLLELPDKEKIELWREAIFNKVIQEKIALWVFIIYDLNNSNTYYYHINKHGNIQEGIAFGKLLSRGADIMPKIERMFSK